MRMKVVGDLGQVLFCPIELGDEDSIRRAVAHSNIVINCIGRGFDTMNFTLEDVNITGPARIARICKEMGVERFINFSHINARQNPEAAFLPGGSRFLRTKYQGELAVRAEFPEATIFRCADVYGQGDNFINFWFSSISKAFSRSCRFLISTTTSSDSCSSWFLLRSTFSVLCSSSASTRARSASAASSWRARAETSC